eukprot:SAG31_NODE_1405_length_8488_cov_2.786029_10_plen_210_part_00
MDAAERSSSQEDDWYTGQLQIVDQALAAFDSLPTALMPFCPPFGSATAILAPSLAERTSLPISRGMDAGWQSASAQTHHNMAVEVSAASDPVSIEIHHYIIPRLSDQGDDLQRPLQLVIVALLTNRTIELIEDCRLIASCNPGLRYVDTKTLPDGSVVTQRQTSRTYIDVPSVAQGGTVQLDLHFELLTFNRHQVQLQVGGSYFSIGMR